MAVDERRVVTVLFADLVGFTTLSERMDPEVVKNLVDRSFDRLARDVTAHGGQVDKIVGDALVALFGAPVAHEDDAERAVRAALAMQRTLAEESDEEGHGLQMRIGVNTGEVLVGAMRAAGSVTAMGDVVNTASRLQASAAPGEVLVGPVTYGATTGTISYEPRGVLAAKGREEPVETWLAVRAVAPPGFRPRRDSVPLVGRDHELTLMSRSVDVALANERAAMILVLGDVGLGKSRLVEELATWSMEAHRALVREGRCAPYGEANVWWPIAEAIRGALGVSEDDPSAAVAAAVSDEVRRTVPAGTEEAAVTRMVSGLLTLLGEGMADGRDPAAIRRRATRALIDYLSAATARRPVLLKVSDLHFADDVVLDLFDEVFEALHHRPLVVVSTARPVLLDRWSPRPGRHNSLILHLDPLSQEATGELLEVLSGGQVRPEVVSAFYNRSGGNPFYVEELVALLDRPGHGRVGSEASVDVHDGHEGHHDHDGHGHGGDGYGGEGPRPITRAAAFPQTLPGSLRGLVAARLDDLDSGSRAVLQDAAVLGVRGSIEGLERMSRSLHRPVDVIDALTDLVANELMTTDHRRWAFRSDLVREVAYQTITKADRAARHTGIAVYLEDKVVTQEAPPAWVVDQLAHHYGAAAFLVAEMGSMTRLAAVPPDLDRRARRWLVEAGRKARGDLALPTARRHLQRALDLVGPDLDADPEGSVELLLDLTSLAVALWDQDCARDHVATAHDLAERAADRRLRAEVMLARGMVEQREGRADQAIALLAEAAEAFAALGDHDGQARSLRERAQVEILGGRMASAERSATQALEAFTVLEDLAGQGWAHQNLAWIAFISGQLAVADGHAQAAVELFANLDDGHGSGWAWGILAWIRFQQGQVDEAGRLADLTAERAQAMGDPWALAITQMLTASIRLWSGETDLAIEMASAARLGFERLADTWGEGQAAAILGRALVMSGAVDAGLDMLDAAGAARSGPVEDPDGDEAWDNGRLPRLVRAAVAVQLGQPSLAEDIEDDLRPVAAAGGVEAASLLGMLALQRGDLSPARRYLWIDEASAPSANLVACRALFSAASGVGSVPDVGSLDDVVGATYLDRGFVAVAAALVAAREQTRSGLSTTLADGAGRAMAGVNAAIEAADATGDRVAMAVFRLAGALVADRIGDPTAVVAKARAESALGEVGVAAHGWRTVFELALEASPNG